VKPIRQCYAASAIGTVVLGSDKYFEFETGGNILKVTVDDF